MRKNGNNIFMGINNIADSDTEVEADEETDELEEGGETFPSLAAGKQFFTPFSCGESFQWD